MNRLSVILFFLFCFSYNGWSQTWTRMQSWGLDFESIHWINSQEGVIVGEKLIIQSGNGGTTWTEVLQKFDNRFYDVVFLDESKGVAVGENGVIYFTSDKGKSWQKRESGSTTDLLSIEKISISQLVVVGKKGEVLVSNDSGNTWQKVSSGTTLNLNDITFINQNTAFIAADDGKILKSSDMGKTWSISSLSTTNDFYGIAFSSQLIGYAVGENGHIQKTVDGGITWAPLNSTVTTSLRKVAISPVDNRIVVALGDGATVVRTTNSGSTFSRINLGAGITRNIKGAAFKPNSNELFASGQNGYALSSTNAGASWTQRLAGIRNHFTSVDFKNQTTGFIAGENGNLFVTSNSATTLVNRSLPEPLAIETIDFWNTSFGYTSSPGGKIYRTGNSGSTWVPVFNPSGKTISGFYLFAPSVLYAAGPQGFITRSFDSGGTWDQSVASNTSQNLKDLLFFDFGVGFAIGEKGQISWSFGGSIWENIPKVTEQNLNAIAKLDTTRALIVGDGGIILKTGDKAKTWRKIESGTTKKLNSIDFFNENVGFIAGEEGLALVTVDGGETWLNSPTGTIRNLSAVSAGTDTKAYFVGDDGSIIAYDCIPPSGSLGAISGDAQSCISSEVYSINADPQSGSEITWRVDGGVIISGQGTNQIEVEWTSTGRNAVLVSRANFCGSGETSSLEVSVGSAPTSNLIVTGEGSACRENTYVYSLPNSEGTTYTWAATGGEVTKGQGTHQVEIRWNQSGQQLVSVAQENRCGKTDPIVKAVLVKSAPDQPSPISGEPQVGLGEQIYEIVRIAGLDYRWALSGTGGKIISGQGTSRIVVLWEKEGDYELSVEAQNECNFGPKRVLPVNVNVITALEPISKANLKIYPNPSQGQVSVSSLELDNWSSLVVFNPMGQLIQSLDISIGQTEINLYGLPRGLVLIQLQGKNGVISKKVLVR